MKVVRNIFSVLLAIVFLVSVTGFRYTRHTCLESGIVRIILDDDYTCCTEEPGNCCQEVSACCADEGSSSCGDIGSQDDCCINQTRYLKAGDDYSVPAQTGLPKIMTQITLVSQSTSIHPESYRTTEEKAHAPPDPYTSGELLIQHSVFLI